MFLRKRLMVAAVCAAGLVFAQSAAAVTGSASGTVQYVYLYGDGSILVTGMVFATGTCTNNSGFTVPATHPNIARILALVMAAKAQGNTITVLAKTDSCWYPTIINDASTYVVVSP